MHSFTRSLARFLRSRCSVARLFARCTLFRAFAGHPNPAGSFFFMKKRLLSNLEDSVVLPHLSVAREVRDKLGLPLWLAAKYTASVFLLHLRFQARERPVGHTVRRRQQRDLFLVRVLFLVCFSKRFFFLS